MRDAPVIAHDRQELADALAATSGTRALVMTMGALHEGHLTLVRRARTLADHIVVSIFVNPTQFAPGEDFDAYPRTLDADVEKLAAEGVEVVYAPEPQDVYPVPPRITVDPGPIARVLEGATRPTHLAGVALVVTKVINLTRPQVAVFGQKDAPQLTMVRTLVRDLDLPVSIASVPISRDTDGVARSSRNRYLSEEERHHARALSRALQVGARSASLGGTPAAVLADTRAVLAAEDGVEIDYVALTDPDTFDCVEGDVRAGTPAFLLVAARVGTTRLIDNTLVTLGGGSSRGGE